MGTFPAVAPLYKPLQSLESFKGKVVLVQGGSSGLGKELALIYAERGCRMVVTGRNEVEL